MIEKGKFKLVTYNRIYINDIQAQDRLRLDQKQLDSMIKFCKEIAPVKSWSFEIDGKTVASSDGDGDE